MSERDEIKAALDDMGIEYDGRLGTEKLQEFLDQVTSPEGVKPAADLVACTVIRDYWPDADERVKAGTVVHVEPMAAIEGIESGILSRVK